MATWSHLTDCKINTGSRKKSQLGDRGVMDCLRLTGSLQWSLNGQIKQFTHTHTAAPFTHTPFPLVPVLQMSNCLLAETIQMTSANAKSFKSRWNAKVSLRLCKKQYRYIWQHVIHAVIICWTRTIKGCAFWNTKHHSHGTSMTSVVQNTLQNSSFSFSKLLKLPSHIRVTLVLFGYIFGF